MGKSKSGNIQGRKGRRFSEELKGVSLDQILIVPIDAAKHHGHEKKSVFNKLRSRLRPASVSLDDLYFSFQAKLELLPLW